MSAPASASASASGRVHPDDIRSRFSAALSAMYRAEVPQYGDLLTLVADINADTLKRDPALAEAVLRMVQEALTNSARHAGATTLAVSLVQHDGCLRVAIEDDGHLHGAVREGNGLAGMRERIDALGGHLALATGRRGALRIEAELPA